VILVLIFARVVAQRSGGKGRRVSDLAADDAYGAQELDPVGVDVGFGRGPADQCDDRVVGRQVAVDLLADRVGFLRSQDRARPPQVGLELLVSGLVLSGSPGALLRRGPLRTELAALTAHGSGKP
jgi:hypothetical protein